MDKESDFFGTVLKIGVGIFLGTMLVWITGTLIIAQGIKQVATVATTSLQEIGDRATAASRRREAEKAADEFFAKQRREEAENVAANRRERERRKERAWQAFFQPSAQCAQTTSVECGNVYIRARREFDRRYADGEL